MSRPRRRAGTAGLTLLGAGRTRYPKSLAEARLECFENRYPRRRYTIEFDCPEFTAICPITGQPDFGHIRIRYMPRRLCVESKSLKLYLFAFRQEGIFHEEAVNRILDDLVAACAPREAEVVGEFRPRGGISLKVTARHPAEAPRPSVRLPRARRR